MNDMRHSHGGRERESESEWSRKTAENKQNMYVDSYYICINCEMREREREWNKAVVNTHWNVDMESHETPELGEY